MTRRSLAGLFIALALILAACGDDSGSNAQDVTVEDGDGGESQDSGDVLPSDLSDFFSGDCAQALGAYNEALASFGASFSPGTSAEDTTDLLNQVAEAAPDEIGDDFAVLANAFGEFAQVLADAGVDFSDPTTFEDPNALAALQSLGDIFDEDELAQASDNIASWFAVNCG